jgi:cholesterol transport system auxiliary component
VHYFLFSLWTKKIRCLIAVGCLCLLQACSIFKPITLEPLNYYLLSATPATCNSAPSQSRNTILVAMPRASTIYNSPRMIYFLNCYQLQYFTHNRWADTPCAMLYPLLIQSLQNNACFQAIINTPTSTGYDWILNTQLFSFQQEFLSKPSQFRIALRAQLINAHTHCLIATQDFMVVQKAPIDNPHGGAIAANLATKKMLRKINNFCLDWTR